MRWWGHSNHILCKRNLNFLHSQAVGMKKLRARVLAPSLVPDPPSGISTTYFCFVLFPAENWSNNPIWTHPVGIAVPDAIRTTDAGFMFVVATDYLDNPEYVSIFSSSQYSVCRTRHTSWIRYFYRPPTKLREGNVFTGVCHSVHGGRGLGYQVLSRGGRVYPTPPPSPEEWRLLWQSVRVHPTGILSCYRLSS